MLRPILTALAMAVVVVVPHPGRCAEETDGTILISFHDGGRMYMSFAGTHLDVTTRHGTLKIAVKEIHKIELATRIPREVQTAITQAVRDLGSEDFNVRDAASRKLKRFRERAYADLVEAATSSDSEVSRRAKELLDWLREAVPASKLRVRHHDTIHTSDSMIAGKIQTDMIPVESPQFGKLDLKLADAAGILFLGNNILTELKLEGTYAMQTEAWLDTNLEFINGTMISVEASGEIDMYATQGYFGQYVGTPSGKKAWPGQTGLPREPGTLIGKFGERGTPFVIGSKYEGMVGEGGRLYLRADGNPYNVQTQGHYNIQIRGGNPIPK